MVNTARIADLIRDPLKTEGITEAIEEGGYHHMQSFAQHLVQHVLDERVDFETAATAATNRHDFEIAVQQAVRLKQVEDAANAPAEPEPELRSASGPIPVEGAGYRSGPPRGGAAVVPAAFVPVSPGCGVSCLSPRGPRPDGERCLRGAGLGPERRRSRTLPAQSSSRSPSRPPQRAPEQRSYASFSRSGARPARPTASRGRCSARSTRSSRTSGGTWARARPARSAGCSSCPRPGSGGAGTSTATASPTHGIPTTASTPPRATWPRPAPPRISRARSSPTTTPTGTSRTSSSWPGSSPAAGASIPRWARARGSASATSARTPVFRLDSMEKRLSDARKALNKAQRAVLDAEERAQELDTEVLEAEQRAGDPTFSDEEFQAARGRGHPARHRARAPARPRGAQARGTRPGRRSSTTCAPRPRSRRPPSASRARPARRARARRSSPASTSSRSAAARRSSRSGRSTTTTRPRTSPRRRARPSTRSRTASSWTPTRARPRTAGSASRCSSPPGRPTCTATSRTWSRRSCPARRRGRHAGRPRRLDGPLDRAAPPPPARAHERRVPAERGLVPGLRRDRLLVAGRGPRAGRLGGGRPRVHLHGVDGPPPFGD